MDSTLDFRISVSTIEFSDGTRVGFDPNDTVIVVGSNNTGKSALLRGIRAKAKDFDAHSHVVKSLEISKLGDENNLSKWLETNTEVDHEWGAPHFFKNDARIPTDNPQVFWRQPKLGNFADFFIKALDAEKRVQTSNPAKNIAISTKALTHPIHYLQKDDNLEIELSALFKNAFRQELIVNRNAGSEVPLHIGERPIPEHGQDRLSSEYCQILNSLPRLDQQGDGMRGYTGILLNCFLGNESVLLLDEPEAFLHPPQARLLAKTLVGRKREGTQLFLATHSGDILRGVLEAGSSDVKVIRVARSGSVNIPSLLDKHKIAEIWKDPLLRHSNVLDGVFHEKVVICESDGDCSFYSAVADAIKTNQINDVMYTHCGGKDRMPTVIRALRELRVPLCVIADFDALDREATMQRIVEAVGGNWTSLRSDWHLVYSQINSKKSEFSPEEAVEEIKKSLVTVSKNEFPEKAKSDIRAILKKSSVWQSAKNIGESYIPSGEASAAYQRLKLSLMGLCIHIVPVGEMEGFCRTIGGHGPLWVNQVLTKDLLNDPELGAAREFVKTAALA